MPLEVSSKRGITADVVVWNATTGFLHHLQGLIIQPSGDMESKESLHLTQLPGDRVDPTSGVWSVLLCQVEEILQVVLQKKDFQYLVALTLNTL